MRRISGTRPDAWAALADPVRWSILALLAERPRSVTDLCERLALPQSTVSTHLGILRDAELVEARKHGYFNVYEVRRRPLMGMAASIRSLAEQAWSSPSDVDEEEERRYGKLEEKWETGGNLFEHDKTDDG